MKAITTRFKGPTNFRGSRIIASDMDGNRVTISRDHADDIDRAHRGAAEALVRKMGWEPCRLVEGSVREGRVFVLVTPWDSFEIK